jgi:hypothetical protein
MFPAVPTRDCCNAGPCDDQRNPEVRAHPSTCVNIFMLYVNTRRDVISVLPPTTAELGGDTPQHSNGLAMHHKSDIQAASHMSDCTHVAASSLSLSARHSSEYLSCASAQCWMFLLLHCWMCFYSPLAVVSVSMLACMDFADGDLCNFYHVTWSTHPW